MAAAKPTIAETLADANLRDEMFKAMDGNGNVRPPRKHCSAA